MIKGHMQRLSPAQPRASVKAAAKRLIALDFDVSASDCW